jgi:hypothetical protein
VDDAGLLEDLQMVGQQIARQREIAGQLAWRRIAENQSVDDGQPGRFAQRRVNTCALVKGADSVLAANERCRARHRRRTSTDIESMFAE